MKLTIKEIIQKCEAKDTVTLTGKIARVKPPAQKTFEYNGKVTSDHNQWILVDDGTEKIGVVIYYLEDKFNGVTEGQIGKSIHVEGKVNKWTAKDGKENTGINTYPSKIVIGSDTASEPDAPEDKKQPEPVNSLVWDRKDMRMCKMNVNNALSTLYQGKGLPENYKEIREEMLTWTWDTKDADFESLGKEE